MLLSEEKATHLSHIILDCLKKGPGVRFLRPDADVLKEIKRVLSAEVAEEAEIDQQVRAKLVSYSRHIVEGSQEWDVLYRKTFDEESRKRRRG
jgi:hypothetical protein